MRRQVAERDPGVLRLHAVHGVPERPAAALGALAVAALAAEPARSAAGDAGDEHAVSRNDTAHRLAHLLDRSDGLMPEDPTCLDLGDVALEDVQVGATDRDRIDSDDDVGVGLQLRVGTCSQLRWPGP